MSTRHEKWVLEHAGKPRIFDVDTKAVDKEGTWVRVRRRVLNRGIEKEELLFALNDHPSGRLGMPNANTGAAFFKGVDELPMLLQERIAVLKIAEAGRVVPGIGKRWSNIVLAMVFEWTRFYDDAFRFFTIEVDCEAIHDSVRSGQ